MRCIVDSGQGLHAMPARPVLSKQAQRLGAIALIGIGLVIAQQGFHTRA